MSLCAHAQFNSYQSVNTPFGGRNAALGGNAVSLGDGDVMQFSSNPAILDSVQTGSIGLSYSPFFAGIFGFQGAYSHQFDQIGNMSFAISYLDYGDFTQTADNGDVEGEFSASDLMLVVGKSHTVGSFSLGVNLKYAQSGIETYGSSMILGDLGGVYRSPKMDWTIGLVLRNFGFVFNQYSTSSLSVPFDVIIGTSIKPEHMPFRFTLTAYNFTQEDIYFQEANDVSTSRSVEIADRFLRHIAIGTELIISDGLQFLLGYNHLRRQELKINDTAYGAGFSFGLKLAIKQFQIRYSHATYQAAGGTDYFTLQTNIHSFKKVL
ncbi:MAG: hypothetical protein CMB80_29260 [Flammeovirgaceae bacterium]|nr:hypothetical protein [Flammeovirgaceae bacterium]MBE60917.1 hypothetical protein [Flammeovirgaceae bacterium]MBR09253.1 hypothetical protein [Rickettsiales bacterium]|tara:strand:- start:2264 stop:3226 length:963 start_codon:yes stop_codon:yes gene_type:complete